jgi:hypothetical protein
VPSLWRQQKPWLHLYYPPLKGYTSIVNKKAFRPKGRKALAYRVTTQVNPHYMQIRSLTKVRELLFRYPLPVNVGSLRLSLHIPQKEIQPATPERTSVNHTLKALTVGDALSLKS